MNSRQKSNAFVAVAGSVTINSLNSYVTPNGRAEAWFWRFCLEYKIN